MLIGKAVSCARERQEFHPKKRERQGFHPKKKRDRGRRRGQHPYQFHSALLKTWRGLSTNLLLLSLAHSLTPCGPLYLVLDWLLAA
jgi:hypothetical protein